VLDTKVANLTKQLEAKADAADTLKWNDRIALRNEDMRIYPRCLDNPGPNSPRSYRGGSQFLRQGARADLDDRRALPLGSLGEGGTGSQAHAFFCCPENGRKPRKEMHP